MRLSRNHAIIIHVINGKLWLLEILLAPTFSSHHIRKLLAVFQLTKWLYDVKRSFLARVRQWLWQDWRNFLHLDNMWNILRKIIFFFESDYILYHLWTPFIINSSFVLDSLCLFYLPFIKKLTLRITLNGEIFFFPSFKQLLPRVVICDPLVAYWLLMKV